MDKIQLVNELARLAGKAQGLGYVVKGFVVVEPEDVIIVLKSMQLPNNDEVMQGVSKAFNEGFEAARKAE